MSNKAEELFNKLHLIAKSGYMEIGLGDRRRYEDLIFTIEYRQSIGLARHTITVSLKYPNENIKVFDVNKTEVMVETYWAGKTRKTFYTVDTFREGNWVEYIENTLYPKALILKEKRDSDTAKEIDKKTLPIDDSELFA